MKPTSALFNLWLVARWVHEGRHALDFILGVIAIGLLLLRRSKPLAVAVINVGGPPRQG